MNPQQYRPASADGQEQLQPFRSFVESLHDPIYRLAYRLLQDRELAAQEVERTFIEVFRRHAEEGFSPTTGSMRTAAYRVLIHRCKMAKASGKRRLKPRKLSPRTILEAVDALPDEVRLIVSLKYECQLSYEEIGEILEMSPERVKKGVWRSRERLSEWMEEPRSPLSFGIIMH